MTEDEFIFVPEYGYSVTKRQIVWQDDYFIASISRSLLEDGSTPAFFHLDVADFSLSALQTMLQAWRDHRDTLPDVLFTMADEDSQALDRLRGKFGFREVSAIPCTDGTTRKLFVHFNK